MGSVGLEIKQFLIGLHIGVGQSKTVDLRLVCGWVGQAT